MMSWWKCTLLVGFEFRGGAHKCLSWRCWKTAVSPPRLLTFSTVFIGLGFESDSKIFATSSEGGIVVACMGIKRSEMRDQYEPPHLEEHSHFIRSKY